MYHGYIPGDKSCETLLEGMSWLVYLPWLVNTSKLELTGHEEHLSRLTSSAAAVMAFAGVSYIFIFIGHSDRELKTK